VCGREAVGTEELDGLCGVGAAAVIGDGVDGGLHGAAVRVRVHLELRVHRRLERVHADLPGECGAM